MYIPSEFEIKDLAEIKQFIQANPLGILISQTSLIEPKITHIPFLLLEKDDAFHLEAHLAMKNSHVEELKKGKHATLIFQGQNAYISSSVYEKENVPTWNYQAIHLFGTIEVFTKEDLFKHLNLAVSSFEKGRKNPLEFKKFSPKMIESMVDEIMGFRFYPLKIEASYKLSQNRNERDYKAIVSDLETGENQQRKALAKEMKRTRK